MQIGAFAELVGLSIPTSHAALSTMPGRTAEGENWRVARSRMLLRATGGSSTERVCP